MYSSSVDLGVSFRFGVIPTSSFGALPLLWSFSPLLSGRWDSVLLFLVLVAGCCERPGWVVPVSPSISSLLACRLVAGGCNFGALPSRCGDVEEGFLQDGGHWVKSLQQGSTEAVLGSTSKVVRLWLPSLPVEGRPLPPPLPVAAFSDRRLKEMFNLRAAMPSRRPLSSSTVSSRCLAPSGSVPGGEVLDCAAACCCGGRGAGPDGVFLHQY